MNFKNKDIRLQLFTCEETGIGYCEIKLDTLETQEPLVLDKEQVETLIDLLQKSKSDIEKFFEQTEINQKACNHTHNVL